VGRPADTVRLTYNVSPPTTIRVRAPLPVPDRARAKRL